MPNCSLPVSLGEATAAALRYLRHFPEAHNEGATLCLPTGELLFISPEMVRASSQETTP